MVLVFGVVLATGTSPVLADDETPTEHHEAAPPEEHHEAAPAEEHHEAAPTEEHHEAAPAEHHEVAPAEHHEAAPAEHHDEAPAAQHEADATPDAEADADEVPYLEFDADGDGKMEPEEIADAKELHELEKDMPKDVDAAALEKRPDDAEMKPSIDVETFRKIVRLTKKFQLGRMQKKMAKSAAKKMSMFSTGVFCLSLAGLLLLATPLVLRKKYPGQGAMLMKYSGLAALTFFVTVNLFGGVLMVMRTAQGALGEYTNPTLAICGGTFDTLDTNAEEFITTGKELFVPTLEQMKGNSDEQPAVLLIENGMRIVKDAKVFMSIAKMFKKISFVFEVLPIVLLGVTLILFLLALKPTLIEIIKLPSLVAEGKALGRDVVKGAMRRVGSEFVATLCTIGVLFLITLVSAFVLGRVVQPAIDALLGYFSLAVSYLQFQEGASSGMVFLALFAVILFLVFNLASLILSTAFFLGKSQKIFQAKFTDGEPIAKHARFFKWGIPSLLLVQLFPLLFVVIADKILVAINEHLIAGVSDAADVPWTKIMLAGPLFLVLGYGVAFWGARGLKAIGFLFSYKVKPKLPKPTGGDEPGVTVPPQ